MIRFRVEEESAVRQIEVVLDYITIGRALGCTIPLKDLQVARFHASLERKGTGLLLKPSGRGVGTWLNGSPVEEAADIRVGDRMTFGKTHVILDAILPGRRIPPPGQEPEAEKAEEATAQVLPPDSALVEPESKSLLERSGVFRVFGRKPLPPEPAKAAPPLDPAPAVPAQASPAEANRSIGFSTEMLRAPGSQGAEEAHALRRILEINKRIARVTEEDRLLDLVLQAAADLTGAERGLVLVPTAEGGGAEVRRDLGGGAADRDAWSAAARRVMSSGRGVSLEGDGASQRALLCVPLRGEKGVLGLLYLDRRPGDGPFPARASVLLEALADQASLALQTAALVRENRSRSEDLEAAGRRLAEANRALEEALRDRTVELRTAREEAARARSDLQLKFRYDRIIGRSAPMRTLLSLVDKVTESTVPILIEGESGTGKELVARAVHFNGSRSGKPFVVENCAAVPDALIENELFGHERGSYTGAERSEEGLFERADGGTLFLDEVGDMSPEMQKKVLRVFQEGEVRRVGGKTVKRVDVRVLSATNRDLVRMVKDGRFREDLFYRLCVVRVRIPPLRERLEDVPMLAAHFLDRIAREAGGEAPRLEADALDALAAYPWPGNVRELENEIRRAATLSEGVIVPDVLSPHVRDARGGGGAAGTGPQGSPPLPSAEGPPGRTLREAVEGLERVMLLAALRDCSGNKTRAARVLGLSRLGLRKKMARFGMDG